MQQVTVLEASVLSRTATIEDIIKLAIEVADLMHDRETARWLHEELQGYAISDRISAYRRVTAHAGMTIDHSWTEFTWVNADQAPVLTTWSFGDSAPQLEHSAKVAIAISRPLDRLEAQNYIHEKIPFDVIPELRLPVNAIKEVLAALRRRIYEWAASLPESPPTVAASDAMTPVRPSIGSNIFIVHGRDHIVRDRLDLFLSKDLGLKTIVMQAGPMRGMTIPEKLEAAAHETAFAIFIITADDVLSLNGKPIRRARQNVILEIGYFWALLGRRDRVAFLVEDHPEMELPSDIQGVGWIPITVDLVETKSKLLAELKAAGLATA
jgi:predicted nucleotide-binding protein